MIKAVIFDLDGVLVDSIPTHISVWQELMKPYGIDFDLEKTKRFNGMKTPEIAKELLQGIVSEQEITEFVKKKQEISTKRIVEEPHLFPETRETIQALKEKGYRVALASSNRMHTIELVLGKTGMKELFEAVVSGGDMKHSKPAPDVFLKTAKQLGVAPKECIVVEDSLNGVKAAKAAGMKCLLVKNQFAGPEVFAMADKEIGSVSEINREMMGGI